MVLGEQPSSLAILRADLRFLLVSKFRLTLAVNDFLRTERGRPGGVLADIPDLSMRSTNLYTVAFEV